MAEIVLDGLCKRFGDSVAVDDLHLTVGDGEFVVLLGPTGAGKTTTLRLVAGLEKPDAGHVRIGGRDMTAAAPAARDAAFVFQQYSLYPHLTVYDNLAFPLRSPTHRWPSDRVDRRVREIAGLVRIEHKLGNQATRLSGGEMQRVAIGRALVRDPALFLMDEPLSSLDAKLRAELRLELKRIHEDLGATILFVTHDQVEAMTMADRIGVIRDGRLVQAGTPREIYERPRDAYVATRLGVPAINLLPPGLVPCPSMPEGVETVGARTEHLAIRRSDNGRHDARVEWIKHLGDQNHIHLNLDGHEVVTLADPAAAIAVGDAVELSLVDPLYFDSRGERIVAADRGNRS